MPTVISSSPVPSLTSPRLSPTGPAPGTFPNPGPVPIPTPEDAPAPPHVEHDPLANLDSFVRVRGDRSGKDVVYHWQGSIYSDVEGERSRRLFDFEGYNVARTVRDPEGGWQLLSREVSVYRDPQTDQILQQWLNPWTQRSVHVVPVLNDPVNSSLQVDPGDAPLVPARQEGGNTFFDLDVFLRYPSPLPRAQYPQYSGSDVYQGAELFGFTASDADLADPQKDSVPATLSWTRLGPWLPWMQMGEHPGRLVYRCDATKLEHGVEDLPADLRSFAAAQDPKFLSAPTEVTGPNETSWTYFKKLLDSGAYPTAPELAGGQAAMAMIGGSASASGVLLEPLSSGT